MVMKNEILLSTFAWTMLMALTSHLIPSWTKGPWPHDTVPFLMQWQLLEPWPISGNLGAAPSSGFFLLLIWGLSRQTESREIILDNLYIRWNSKGACPFWGSCGIFGYIASSCQWYILICRFCNLDSPSKVLEGREPVGDMGSHLESPNVRLLEESRTWRLYSRT